MSIDHLLQPSAKWFPTSLEQALGLREVMVQTSELHQPSGLFMVRKDTVKTEGGKWPLHLKPVQHIDYDKGTVACGSLALPFSRAFFDAHYVFPIKPADFGQDAKSLQDIHLTPEEIERRHTTMMKHYFDALADRYGRQQGLVPAQVKPTIISRLVFAATAVVGLTTIALYLMQSSPQTLEQRRFAEIRGLYHEIKEENLAMIAKEIAAMREKIGDARLQYQEALDKVMTPENAIYIIAPGDKYYDIAKPEYMTDYTQLALPANTSLYDTAKVIKAVCDALAANPGKILYQTDRDGRSWATAEIPQNQVPRTYIPPERGPYKVILSDGLVSGLKDIADATRLYQKLQDQLEQLRKEEKANEKFVPK